MAYYPIWIRADRCEDAVCIGQASDSPSLAMAVLANQVERGLATLGVVAVRCPGRRKKEALEMSIMPPAARETLRDYQDILAALAGKIPARSARVSCARGRAKQKGPGVQ